MRTRRGRPPIADVRQTRRLEIGVTTLEHEALRRVAADLRRPLAAIIRDAVNEFVGDYGERRVFSPGKTRGSR